MYLCFCFFFFFKQKTAYEMRISDWSSDVCSSDLSPDGQRIAFVAPNKGQANDLYVVEIADGAAPRRILRASGEPETLRWCRWSSNARILCQVGGREDYGGQIYGFTRSEGHTSELQSLMRISYAVFCLKQKKKTIT